MSSASFGRGTSPAKDAILLSWGRVCVWSISSLVLLQPNGCEFLRVSITLYQGNHNLLAQCLLL